jgi:hypothetical protein
MFEGKIGISLSARLWLLVPFAFLFAVFGIIDFSILTREHGYPIYVSILVTMAWVIVLVPLMVMSKELRFLRWFFRPALEIKATGLTTNEGFFIPWEAVSHAVIFTQQGHDHFGLHLKPGLDTIGQTSADEFRKKSPAWENYRLCFVIMLSAVAMPRDMLVSIFQDHYKIPVNLAGVSRVEKHPRSNVWTM